MGSYPTEIKDLKLKQGADYYVEGTIIDPDTKLPVDISGDTFVAKIYDKYGTGKTLLFTIPITFLTDGIDGKYVRKILKTEVNGFSWKKGVWDFFWIDNTNNLTYKILRGSVSIEESVSV